MVEVRKYSSRHLEIKFLLPLAQKKSYKKDIAYYLFTPKQLLVNESTTSVASLRHKFQSFGRYGSPELTLKELLDENNPISPLTLLSKYVDDLSEKGELKVSSTEFVHEAQAVVNSLRHQLRAFYLICKLVIMDENILEFRKIIKKWKKQHKILELKFMDLLDKLTNLSLENDAFVTAIFWADESSSLINERYATDILLEFKDSEKLEPIVEVLLKIINHEQRRRKKMGYSSLIENKEKLAFRRETLSKWSKSVLTLKPQVSRTPKRINEFVAGLAASLAMAFAIIATFFAQSYSSSKTFRFEFLVVIIYIFKDRIKEWVKRLFLVFQPRLIPDEICDYVSPRSGKTVCTCKNRLIYTTPVKLNKEINELRRKKSENFFYKMMGEETIVKNSHYLKLYPLNKASDINKTPWIKDFALVDRIRIDDWLKEMVDDIIDLENEETCTNKTVYHMHLVIEEKSSRKKIEYSHFLIVINHSGILYVESLDEMEPSFSNNDLIRDLQNQIAKNKEKFSKKVAKKAAKQALLMESESEEEILVDDLEKEADIDVLEDN